MGEGSPCGQRRGWDQGTYREVPQILHQEKVPLCPPGQGFNPHLPPEAAAFPGRAGPARSPGAGCPALEGRCPSGCGCEVLRAPDPGLKALGRTHGQTEAAQHPFPWGARSPSGARRRRLTGSYVFIEF